MTTSIPTVFSIRRWFSYEDEVHATEIGKPADGAVLRKIVIGACIKNPFANGQFTADLSEVVKNSPALGLEIGRRLLDRLQGEPIASYGKACVVGTAGEYEHGNAFLTATMMDPLRECLGGGLAWVPSTGKRGGLGTTVDIPLAHKDALYVRSHYDTVTATFPDGPNPDEVLVLMAVATRGRLHARLGGLKEADVRARDGLK
jgi:hypothetical protein